MEIANEAKCEAPRQPTVSEAILQKAKMLRRDAQRLEELGDALARRDLRLTGAEQQLLNQLLGAGLHVIDRSGVPFPY